MYLYDLVKFEGRIEALEIHNGVLNTLGGAGDHLIKSSAILSTVAGSVSLGAQTVFLDNALEDWCQKSSFCKSNSKEKQFKNESEEYEEFVKSIGSV